MSAGEKVCILALDHAAGLRRSIEVVNLDSLSKFETTFRVIQSGRKTTVVLDVGRQGKKGTQHVVQLLTMQRRPHLGARS